jgi:SulP family sulfate permease
VRLPTKSDFPSNRRELLDDVIAGITVAIVALPLAIGFGITSGMSAAAGISTAIIAGFIASLLGGSRLQVSGPTGAMTVILIPVIQKYGVNAIPALGVLAGAMVILMGLFKLGTIINKVPHFVIEGFTLGIAVIIALQQLPMALGVTKGSGERTLIIAFNTIKSGSFNYASIFIVSLTLIFKFNFTKILKALKVKAYIPASFGALLFGSLVAKVFSFDLKTIGEIPRNIATFTAPKFINIPSLIWPALMIALLAAIESLLSARVADSMAHMPKEKRLEPDQELLGQGFATAVASIFGGQPATGAIARTSVNVRSHAHTRIAAMVHSLVLLLIILLAAPIFSQIPQAVIAGVLIGTSIRILNPTNLKELLQTTKGEIAVFAITAISTISIDLIWGIAIGIFAHFTRNYLVNHGKSLK